MSEPDVRLLPESQTLEEADFPASAQADFRIHMEPEVHRGIQQHAGETTSVEICGILVGDWLQDGDGPWLRITQFIRCDSASSQFAEVTFTHESWAQINQEMDSKYSHLKIVGWYHSHPDFGIFLSDRDCFIQQNFFSGAGQVAYVVDPVRHLEGVFDWRDGTPTPVAHYWVGDRIVSVLASERSGQATARPTDNLTPAPEFSEAGSVRASAGPVAFWLTVSLGVCLFLLGYLLARQAGVWERQRMIQGTVAHYGINRMLRPGLEDRLQDVQQRLDAIRTNCAKLLTLPDEDLTAEQKKQRIQDKRQLLKSISVARNLLRETELDYGFSSEERAALAQLIAAKQAELNQLLPPSNPASPPAAAPSTPPAASDAGPQ